MKPARAVWLLSYLLFSANFGHAAEATPPAGAPASAAAPVKAEPAKAEPAKADTGKAEPVKGALVGNGKEVDLKADTLSVDVLNDRYVATGNVRMVQGDTSLLADSVIYSRLSGDALAEGHIFLEKSGDTLKGDRLSLNVFSEQGEVSNGELFVKKSNFRVHGKQVLKTGDEDYRIEHGTFTTCDGDSPSWHFEARKINVTLDEYATARDAVFYAGDIPLLYTPYLIFPVKRDRQSGLLIPKIGHSSKKGYYLYQPYYWAINQSQDVTFDLDLESNRGAGLGVDYRYVRARGSEGRMQAFGIYDTEAKMFRGELDQSHLELLTPNTTLSSNIRLVTDRSYFIDYGELAGDYNRQLLESTISFDHKWDRYAFAAELRYTEALQGADNNSTLQRLPALSFTGAGEKIAGPLFFSMNSSLINFQRQEGVTGERLELHPRLSLYEKMGPLDISMYGGYRQRVYDTYGADAPDGIKEIGQADAGATVSLPLERIYDGTLRHVLIPSLQYGFVEGRRDSNMPFFDYGDRVLGQSIAGWSVANVLTRKDVKPEGPEYRDVLYLKLSQGYQFSGQRRDLLTLVDPGHRLTDLMIEGRLSPIADFALTMDGRYNTIDNNLSTLDLGVAWKPDQKKGEPNKAQPTKGVSLSYRFSRDEIEYLEGQVAYPILSDVNASVVERYSFDKNGFLESRYSLEYKRQCWSVILLYSDRPGTTTIPGNREFTVNFALYGIGTLLPVRAF